MSSEPSERSIARRSLVFWAIAGLFLLVLALVYVASQAFLLAFGGILFGTALRGVAEVVSHKLGCSPRWGLALCVIVMLAVVIAAAWWMVPSIGAQATELSDKLRQAYEGIRERAGNSSLGREVIDDASRVQQQLGSFSMRAAGFLGSAVGALGGLLFVAFVALYAAISPEVYRRGAIQLVPRAQRELAVAVLTALATTLRRWLLGRAVSMLAVGVATGLGLWALDIPLALTLGVIAGVFGFVPNLGPLLSAVPALLVALAINPLHALYVAILYVVINLADGYGLTPFLQMRAVSLPPALILIGQVVMGALWGVLGVMFATPIVACILVLVRKLYVEPVLESDSPRDEAADERPA
jgi:predicted PurR-regulated permease PerM